MANKSKVKHSSAQGLDAQNQDNETSSEPKPKRSLYFINETVEDLLRKYLWTGCTSVYYRDAIMQHASELIRQIIRKQGLHTIYPGQDESSFNDLLQVGWCVHPETLIFTDKGIQEIQDIVGNEQIGKCDSKVFGMHGLKQAVNYIRMPEAESLKIKIKFGYNLEVSLDHPLPVLTDNGIIRKQAKDIRCGDLLGLQFNQQCFGDDDEINFKATRGGDWEPPQYWTEDLAYLIGLIISEGSIGKKGICICNDSKEVIDFLLTNNLGLHFIIKRRLVTDCSSARFREFISWLGLNHGTRAVTKFIPSKLLRCSKPIIKAMLRGMFDGDGHSNRFNGIVGYTSISEKLINQLRVVLANFGIITKTTIDDRKESTFPNGITSKNKHVAYQLSMSTTASKIFYDNIGFGIKYKQDKIIKLSNKPWELIDRITTNRVREVARPLTKAAFYPIKKGNILNKECITVSTFSKLCNIIDDKFISDRFEEYCGKFKTRWLPVEEIKQSRTETIDIEVPESGTFTANNVQAFNCQVEKILYKFRARPHCRVCYNPDRPNDSVLFNPGEFEYGIVTYDEMKEKGITKCKKCGTIFKPEPEIKASQDIFGGSETVLFRGISKVFNMWSQVSRTVILAYIKKESRDRKNANAYRTHIDNKPKTSDLYLPTPSKLSMGGDDVIEISTIMMRFLTEAREICKFNKDHLVILDSLERLFQTDERPSEGLVGKLVEHSKLSRAVVTQFLRSLRLRSLEFTDSPLNKGNEGSRVRKAYATTEFEEEV